MRISTPIRHIAVSLTLLVPVLATAQEGQTLTFADLMQVRQIEQPSISPDGRWLAFTAEPDRGDAEVVVREADGEARFSVSPASGPLISFDSRWVAARMLPSLEERETTEDQSALRNGLALFQLPNGTMEEIESVQSFAFSHDGRWLAYHSYAEEDDSDSDESDKEVGRTLMLRNLSDGSEVEVAHVTSFYLDQIGTHIAYAVASTDSARDGLYVRDLNSGSEVALDQRPMGQYTAVTWADGSPNLAFVASEKAEDGELTSGTIHQWDGSETTALVTQADAQTGWIIPSVNRLQWSDDAARLFFGWRPLRADELEHMQTSGDDESGDFDAFDLDDILEGRGVDVWHWNDPRIMPQQKVLWNQEKDRTYMAVYHQDSGEIVPLGGVDLPDVRVPDNSTVALATTDVPYRREFTWMGGQSNAYVIDMSSGERTQITERNSSGVTLSPEGRFVVWYDDGNYHLYDVTSGDKRNLTAYLGVPIANEDHDFPNPAPGYGIGGWLENDAAVLIYDKYDIWVIPTDGGDSWNLTEGRGRAENRIFRVVNTDRDAISIATDGALLLSSYHDLEKNFGFYRAQANRAGVTRLIEEDRRFVFRGKADEVDRFLFTREDYDEFPDLWVSDPNFEETTKVTDVNPGLTERFAWGTSELVEWQSTDGTPMQGVLIKPGNYEEGQRYPVLVYYYRFFSQRLHEFNDPSVNHRPSFPIYASDGYAVFLPDVRFEVGRPGFASTKSVVPGVQKLIDMGVADPDAIALHGHSWSGYQTAFMVTQTDIFKTAITGAPVGNMTSAYSGIRLGSGLARQFQYEMGQSRLSGSLWEARDEYIDNSPIFFADRINTPMLILHGDVDDAVPWEQSIELYLALRRLDKETVFLQYRDEPHHPQQYANKLDWAVKMKEWTDHYLKGEPAPEWIKHGLPYQGKEE